MNRHRVPLCAAALLALALALSACAGPAPAPLAYDPGTHTHVWGYWADTRPVTCMTAGEHIRYCKICRAEEIEPVPVAEDIAARAHSFVDTIVPPTEKEGGYTRRVCTRCGYIVERADETPPLFALLVDDATETEDVLPAGCTALLAGDTVSHHLHAAANGDTPVPAGIARRLAVALTVTAAASGDEISLDTPVTVTAELLAALPADAPRSGLLYPGAEIPVRDLLGLALTLDAADASAALGAALGLDEAAFGARVAARLADLGITHTAFSGLYTADPGRTTLADTAVLFARVLGEPPLAEALSDAVSRYLTIGGVRPAAFLTEGGLRVSALPRAAGGLDFLLLLGGAQDGSAEAACYARFAGR